MEERHEAYARQVRGITAGDAVELIHLIAREVRGSGARRPAVLLGELSRLLPDEVLPDLCVDWLAGADRYGGGGIGWGGEVSRVVEACVALGTPLNPGEAWSDAALADTASRGQPWQDLLSHAVTASSAKPSARWEKTARGLLAAVGERAAVERIGA
jgi:hypothetical protein